MREIHCFGFEIPGSLDRVVRTYDEVRALRELLAKEFPGLQIPPLSSKLLIDVVNFFHVLWGLQDVLASDLFTRFFQGDSAQAVLNEYREVYEAFQPKGGFGKEAFFREARKLTAEEFKNFILQSAGLRSVDKPSILADLKSFNDFCENHGRSLHGSLGLINQIVNESIALVGKAKRNIEQLGPIFAKLHAQADRVNYAKSFFPDLERGMVNLDLVFAKMSQATQLLSRITRQ